MALEFRISGPGGTICAVQLDRGANVADLRSAIQANSGISVAGQRLFRGSHELTPADDLSTLKPEDGCKHIDLLLVRRVTEVEVWLEQLEQCSTAEQVIHWFQTVAPPAAREHREVVLETVTRRGLTLRFTTQALQADKEVVLAAVSQYGLALMFAAPALLADREVVLAAVTQRGDSLQYATLALQADREVVMAAVGQNGFALPFAVEALQNDREVVLRAVSNSGLVLQLAPSKMRADREIVLAATAENEGALQWGAIPLQAKIRAQRGFVALRAAFGARCLRGGRGGQSVPVAGAGTAV